MNKNKAAFTLIELLVVVLIIGILAAVALPQYQRMVLKFRAASIWPVVDGIYKAQQNYFTTHGEYANNFESLDIGISGNTTNSIKPLCQVIALHMAAGTGSVQNIDQWQICMGIYQDQVLVGATPLQNYTGAGWLKTSHPLWQQPTIHCVHRSDQNHTNEYCMKMGYKTESINYAGFIRSFR